MSHLKNFVNASVDASTQALRHEVKTLQIALDTLTELSVEAGKSNARQIDALRKIFNLCDGAGDEGGELDMIAQIARVALEGP